LLEYYQFLEAKSKELFLTAAGAFFRPDFCRGLEKAVML
jgi:hypothetical protein